MPCGNRLDYDNATSTLRGLKRLWDFICLSYTEERPDDLDALADWPIIPTTSGHLVSFRMSKTVLIAETFSEDEGILLKILQKLGCRVADISKISRSYASVPPEPRHILSKRLVGLKCRRDILTMTQHMIDNENVTLAGKLTSWECEKLLRYFQEGSDTFSEGDVDCLKQLPIFRLARSDSRESIHQYSHCYTIDYVVDDSTSDVDDTLSTVIFDMIRENTHIGFLENTVCLAYLYQKLGIMSITMPGIYLDFVLAKMSHFCLKDKLVHVDYIRKHVLPKSSDKEKEEICAALAEIPFIEDINENVHAANFYFDPTNDVFSYMMAPRLLPKGIQGL